MARKRKTEAKPLGKPEPKPTVVRKSTRQRAKKQTQEDKINGDVANTNNSEDCKDSNDDSSQEPIKKANAVPKKSTKRKSLVDKLIVDSGNSQGGESDSQDTLGSTDSPSTQKSQFAVDKQDTANENTLNQVWPDDVIEETIICEEMEVETNSCSIAPDESIVLEQVLLVNNSNFDGKDVVEYTVIESEERQEPMITSSDSVENTSCSKDDHINLNNYQVIEKGLRVLQVSESEISVSSASADVSESFTSKKTLSNYNDNNDNDQSSVDVSEEECRTLRSGKNVRSRKSVNSFDKDNKKESDKKKKTEVSTKNVSLELKLQAEIDEKLMETKISDVSVSTSEEINTQNFEAVSQNSMVLSQEDDNSSSMSDKIELTEILETPIAETSKDKIVNSNVVIDQKSISNPVDVKINVSNRFPTKSRNVLFGSEEHSRDSEIDGKIDSEDTKISSSSENSNDTLLSSNSCREFNMDNKSALNQLNETDKKPGFRSRSGSTDTTESESGSNSSGVRRSNRIKSIGLLKQRSRGRGLVTKPSVDPSKSAIQQEREKLTSSTPPIQEKDPNQNKLNLDTISETQSDKENTTNKTTSSQDVLTPLVSASGTTGYDSDTNKPVKVKSRWRRSSELEMINFGSWSATQPSSGFSNSSLVGTPAASEPNYLNDSVINSIPLPIGLPQDSKIDLQDSIAVFPSQSITNISSETSMIANDSLSNASAVIPKAVGTKISLPMVPVVDREMEERLSQFEHLRENLYLTERYTNKETKRMQCDCFLTEEEIERGELGCGEDCLNRLLMIECGSRCNNGDRCTNKRFQNCEYANNEVFRTEKKGFGLRATSDLDAGEFIMEYVGEVVGPKDFRRRVKEYSKEKNRHYYFMALKSDQIIDATMKGNISRFINHSCDPNAETQKWTVNGELRIGFFIKKFVALGEEITFDYHFQRYGKEAQKCYCEADNCRGWIGDNPKDNKEKTEYLEDSDDAEDESEDEVEDNKEDKEVKDDKEQKPKRRARRKREEKKIIDHMEDEDLEEQIDKLCITGLKNRVHTLTLSRLMVRSREIQHRTRLLKVIQSGEQPCRRLFLDYHGLRLMWSYMMDIANSTTDEAQRFRIEILKTLSTLPIPNKSMLIDSRVLDVIEKWSKQLYLSSSGDSPEDDQSKMKSMTEEMEVDVGEKSNEIKNEAETEVKSEIKTETDNSLISDLAAGLLSDWSNLKEVFKIPKKERIEQMKEHEREADRGYKEDVEKESREGSSYDRYRSDRYSRNESDKRPDRRRGRDSPESEYSRAKDKRVLDERPNLVQVPRMTKFERRQLFALQVAKEEEERQRRQQEDSWQQHETQCRVLGLDPYTTAAFDPQTGYPLFFNHQIGQWQPYPIQEGAEQQCTPVYVGAPVPGSAPTATLPGASPAMLVTMPDGSSMYQLTQPTTSYPSTQGLQVHNGTPVYTEKPPSPSPTPAPPPILDLPPKWKWARDKRGRVYYYHVKERASQWLPPPPDHIAQPPDSSTTSESSDESSSSNGEDEELNEQPEQQGIDMEIDKPEVSTTVVTAVPETKKRRDGLVQERIISPRREEDRVDHKKYKEIKEKLRRHKERAKLKEMEKLRKHRRSNKSKHSKHNTSKFQPITGDISPTVERKIKDNFRSQMANVMVHFLNPYLKDDCKQGKITNTGDFKYLARKLTHFVLAKELKHCKSVDELECNDSVKLKAKDFVRKYMNKFGPVYQKGTDED